MRGLGQEGQGCFSPASQVDIEDLSLAETPRTLGLGLPVPVASISGRRTSCDFYVSLPVGTGDSTTDWAGARFELWSLAGGIRSLIMSADVTSAALEEVLDGSGNVILLRGALLGCRGIACDAFEVTGRCATASSLFGGRARFEAWGDGS